MKTIECIIEHNKNVFKAGESDSDTAEDMRRIFRNSKDNIVEVYPTTAGTVAEWRIKPEPAVKESEKESKRAYVYAPNVAGPQQVFVDLSAAGYTRVNTKVTSQTKFSDGTQKIPRQ